MNLLDRYCSNINALDYDDFSKNTEIKIPDNFNFGYDVVDEYARLTPDKIALVWCNDEGEEKIITFGELKTLSDKFAIYYFPTTLKKATLL